MSTLRDRLKAATAADHDRLEADLGPACSGQSLAAYITYLDCLYGYYAAVEPLLQCNAPLRALGIDMLARGKLGLLADDLAHFRATPSPVSGLAAPIDASASLSEVLGCSYVLEGSTLGGTVLYARFQRMLGLEKGRGASFLYGYGPNTSRMWNTFVEAINSAELEPAEEQSCVAVARRTFRSIGAWYAAYARAGLSSCANAR